MLVWDEYPAQNRLARGEQPVTRSQDLDSAYTLGSVHGLRYEGASNAFAAGLLPKFLLDSLHTSLDFDRSAMLPMWV